MSNKKGKRMWGRKKGIGEKRWGGQLQTKFPAPDSWNHQSSAAFPCWTGLMTTVTPAVWIHIGWSTKHTHTFSGFFSFTPVQKFIREEDG